MLWEQNVKCWKREDLEELWNGGRLEEELKSKPLVQGEESRAGKRQARKFENRLIWFAPRRTSRHRFLSCGFALNDGDDQQNGRQY